MSIFVESRLIKRMEKAKKHSKNHKALLFKEIVAIVIVCEFMSRCWSLSFPYFQKTMPAVAELMA